MPCCPSRPSLTKGDVFLRSYAMERGRVRSAQVLGRDAPRMAVAEVANMPAILIRRLAMSSAKVPRATFPGSTVKSAERREIDLRNGPLAIGRNAACLHRSEEH